MRLDTKRRGPGYWLVVLLVGLIGLVSVVEGLVRLQPVDSAWAAPGANCTGACWQGIRAGVTRIGDVTGLLQTAGLHFEKTSNGPSGAIYIDTSSGQLAAYFYPGFDGFRADNRIMSVCLIDELQQGSLSLARLLSSLGAPDEVRPGGLDGGRLQLTLRYTRRQAEVLLSVPLDSAHLDLSTPADMLCFLTDSMFFYTAEQFGRPIQSDDWRGIAMSQYYPDVARTVARR